MKKRDPKSKGGAPIEIGSNTFNAIAAAGGFTLTPSNKKRPTSDDNDRPSATRLRTAAPRKTFSSPKGR